MKDFEAYMTVMDSGRVERFHSVPGVKTQEVSAHSWGVAMTLLYVAPTCRREVLVWTLQHDCAELWTGDVPFPIKKASKDALDTEENHWLAEQGLEMPQLTETEFLLVKLCDGIEGMKYCIDRQLCGETQASKPFHRWEAFLEQLMLENTDELLVKAKELFYDLVEEYRINVQEHSG